MTFIDDNLNTIIQGDCLEVMKQIPDKSIDLVLTDPPYNASNSNIGFKKGIKQSTKIGIRTLTR